MVYNDRRMRFRAVFFLPFLGVFQACISSVQPVPDAWLRVPVAAAVTPEQLRRVVADTSPAVRANPTAETASVRVVRDAAGARLFRDEVALTPAFEEIESFDVSRERGEVIFSARRAGGFDIGLVAIEGSDISWVPGDPADEVSPRWAPRGHKASYVIRHPGGDLVRTVHIPTAFQLVVDFPFGVVRGLAWDAPAERFAVAWETVDASQRVEVMRYGGEGRRMVIPPAVKLDVDVAPFAGGLLMRPSSVGYSERLPLVIWVTPGRLNAWDDARAALLQEVRSAALVVAAPPDAGVLAAIRESRSLDPEALYFVSAEGSGTVEGATNIVGDRTVARGSYRRNGSVISVDPAVVKSFAARFIAEQLKGTSPSGHR